LVSRADLKLLRKIKEANPSMKVAFVGPHGHIKPDETLNASEDIDFIVRGEVRPRGDGVRARQASG